jgi:hypothetical protein
MKVQDNKLFIIEPKKGFLEPGEIVQIKITYKHMFPGVNKLPVLFKIAKGREIMVITFLIYDVKKTTKFKKTS